MNFEKPNRKNNSYFIFTSFLPLDLLLEVVCLAALLLILLLAIELEVLTRSQSEVVVVQRVALDSSEIKHLSTSI